MLCHKCLKEKEIVNFPFRSKEKGTRQYICKECQKIVSRRDYLKWREKRISQARVRTIANRDIVRRKLWEYLESHPCVDCNFSNPLALEFDHRDGDTKEINICRATTRGGWSWKRVLFEIEKCDVRCRNCHQIKTHKENNSWRSKMAC